VLTGRSSRPAGGDRRANLVRLSGITPAEAAKELGCGLDGLQTPEASARLARNGANVLPSSGHRTLGIALRQAKNPLLALLLAATFVSLVVGQRTDAVIILAIVALSVVLGFFDEYRADLAVRALESQLTRWANVVRDGATARIPAEDVVCGDRLALSVGDILVADARLIEATDLTADEAVLTGESLPVDKLAAPGPHDDELAGMVLAGTVLRSGHGSALVTATGQDTLLGEIANRVRAAPPQSEVQAGLQRFSMFLVAVTAALTIFIFVANAVLGRGILEALLFSLAIAVGLTPQLLPAIVTVSLALGSRRLAREKVIVRHLVAIEDLGNVETLFSDKTGTLTEGRVHLEAAIGPPGSDGGEVLAWASAWLDAGIHTRASNVLDAALAADERAQIAAAGRADWRLAGELPFSYQRRAGALLVAAPGGGRWVIVKGAAEEVMQCCSTGTGWGDGWRAAADASLNELLEHGARVLAVAVCKDDGRPLEQQTGGNLDLVGFLAFSDPPKLAAREALAKLHALNVDVKILTGDHPAVAGYVCTQLGIHVRGLITGAEIEGLGPAELSRTVERNTVFARLSPEQKAAVVAAMQRLGRDVAFLGDGVNDAPALRQADVGISVDDATDVAKAAADVVLLEKRLSVLAAGITEGRRTFANTVKYIMMATSSNFGHMFSAAGASLFLAFLPMLPTQILANNFLYDVSELTLPTDNVDEELIPRPAHWDIRLVFRFMVIFGPASSIYDFLTFTLMLQVFHAHEALFQSGWFVESFCTQTLVIFLLRTQRVPFWRSKPSRPLAATTLACVAIAIALPFSPAADALGFQALSPAFFFALAGMVVTYLLVVEVAKRYFFRHWPSLVGGRPPSPLEQSSVASN
jgi:Mg2+-importing ATPase